MGFWCVIFRDGDYLAEGSRNDSSGLLIVSSHHSMCLSTSSLSVCEDGAIIAIEYTFYKGESTLLIYDALQAIWREYCIEGKAFGLFSWVFFDEVDLFCLLIDDYYAYATLISSCLPLAVSLEFIGRTRTITLTASAIVPLLKILYLGVYWLFTQHSSIINRITFKNR